MNPCRNLAHEFDSSEHIIDANWEKSQAKNDFQVESLYMSEDGEEIFDEETYIEDIENLDILDREKNDGLEDEVIAANDVKQLTEEELNNIRPYVGKEFDSQEDAYDFYNRFADVRPITSNGSSLMTTQEQLPKKKFRKQGKNKVAFREINSQPETFPVQQGSSTMGSSSMQRPQASL
ncbi:hypothetical protein MKW98_014384 [Papaver atlanticum]|uniref:Uncharacterized protein n=1 Tax=Papaver atlanticum TaxID=357466 RepID=A0AAD4SPB7_9MAGN|nr:hypothetical protein MKW98_014384 [Papaver atlanticum]